MGRKWHDGPARRHVHADVILRPCRDTIAPAGTVMAARHTQHRFLHRYCTCTEARNVMRAEEAMALKAAAQASAWTEHTG